MPPLLGSPGFNVDCGLVHVIERCTRDFNAYVSSGMDGVIFENFGDAPFFPGRVPPETVASMTRVILAAMASLDTKGCKPLAIGINVLRNDAISALAIAKVVNADFIRVNIHSGTCATDQGLITGEAHETCRYRQHIHAEDVAIVADVRVKHATPLMLRSLLRESQDLVGRAMVDGGLVFTGEKTGVLPSDEVLAELPVIKANFPKIPLFIGSGVSIENIDHLFKQARNCIDGVIIGTALKVGGDMHNGVDENKASALVKEWLDRTKQK